MLKRLSNLPLIVVLMGCGALAMFAPAIVAAGERDWVSGRSFLYSGVIFLSLTAMVALAAGAVPRNRPPRAALMDVLGAFVVLPLMLAVPIWDAMPGLRLFDAYFEMVSSLTTTGASIFDGGQSRVPDAVHFWRATVGWLGGFLMWVMAVAVLAPLNLGGFEVLGRPAIAFSAEFRQISGSADTGARLRHHAGTLAPIYLGLTGVLWVGLLFFGDTPFVALCHAMATLSTSGISPVGGLPAAGSGIGGELLIFGFLIFALSRSTFSRDLGSKGPGWLLQDPELRAGLVLVAAVTGMLFLRHFVGALEIGALESGAEADAADTAELAHAGMMQGLLALWGSAFTVLSFLSTTGFQSGAWHSAQLWSGLETPGLIFMGLAMIGGGVATTAGGVKLLRVLTLYRHGQRELELLVHPHSVGPTGGVPRAQRRRGIFNAWIFFMLLTISVALVMLALSVTGLAFEPATVLTIAALSTTGPLVTVAGDYAILYSTLGDAAKAILAASMVLGRLETLAILSLLNIESWRG